MKKKHKLVFEGDPVLRIPGKPIEKITSAIKGLAKEMFEIMKESKGVGLAAPQIGESLRIVVLDIPDEEGKRNPIALINPEIKELSPEVQILDEACLSVPGKCGKVPRHISVKVEATSPEGKGITIEGEGLLAQALQHEIDHINGILYIDKSLNIEEVKPGQGSSIPLE